MFHSIPLAVNLWEGTCAQRRTIVLAEKTTVARLVLSSATATEAYVRAHTLNFKHTEDEKRNSLSNKWQSLS